jgi:hypothetical protein
VDLLRALAVVCRMFYYGTKRISNVPGLCIRFFGTKRIPWVDRRYKITEQNEFGETGKSPDSFLTEQSQFAWSAAQYKITEYNELRRTGRSADSPTSLLISMASKEHKNGPDPVAGSFQRIMSARSFVTPHSARSASTGSMVVARRAGR